MIVGQVATRQHLELAGVTPTEWAEACAVFTIHPVRNNIQVVTQIGGFGTIQVSAQRLYRIYIHTLVYLFIYKMVFDHTRVRLIYIRECGAMETLPKPLRLPTM